MTGRHTLETWLWYAFWAGIILVALFAYSAAQAHDSNHPELNGWYEGLKRQDGTPCCSKDEATTLKDVEWRMKDNHYQVWLDVNPGPGTTYAWVDVPPEAVLKQPNKSGRVLVWPLRGIFGMTVRCFMPGAGI